VKVVLRLGQVDRVLESDASRDTGKNTQTQQEGDRNLGISVELDVPEKREWTVRMISEDTMRYAHIAAYSSAQNQSVMILTAVSA